MSTPARRRLGRGRRPLPRRDMRHERWAERLLRGWRRARPPRQRLRTRAPHASPQVARASRTSGARWRQVAEPTRLHRHDEPRHTGGGLCRARESLCRVHAASREMTHESRRTANQSRRQHQEAASGFGMRALLGAPGAAWWVRVAGRHCAGVGTCRSRLRDRVLGHLAPVHRHGRRVPCRRHATVPLL